MVDVILGLQWGDEGKGKLADYFTPGYDVVARFQGGPNAGHSLEINGMKHVLNTIPSGIFHESCMNLIGNGVVVDPVRLKEEIVRTIQAGANVKERLFISRKANLILPTHKLLDTASELSMGVKKIGSTLRGIGPTYRDKYGRSGLRGGDIFSDDFKARYNKVVEKHLSVIAHLGYEDFDLPGMEAEFFESLEYLKEFNWVDSEYLINEQIARGKKVLAEGAQGSMLDIDFGSYPYVTSSNTISGGVCVGLGISPRHINDVKGIFKAYCTRVGSGPFPTELDNEVGQLLRDKGFEYGATTGRPRRTGWLDLVALKYSVMLSGVNELIMTKSDILSGFEHIRAGVGYRINGKEFDHIPFEYCTVEIDPVYQDIPGWEEDISNARSEDELPENCMKYIRWIEEQVKTPMKVVSVGPDREQTIIR